MSDFKIPLTKILEIQPHPGADRLSIAVIYGFQVIIKKDSYNVGDSVLYFQIDSLLPKKLEDFLFPVESKVKLNKGRIKQIRLRKIASQGMIVSPDDIKKVYGFVPSEMEKDYSLDLEIVKFEPPAPKFQSEMGAGGRKVKPLENPLFHKYNGLDNIKFFPTLFKEGEMIVAQEKIHGSNARAAKLPFVANTLKKKIKMFFRKLLKMPAIYEFCYGSNNVQLQERTGYTGYYGEDIYGKVFKSIDMESKLKDGETVFGEIYGAGIQKDYAYGCKEGEQKFILFDVKQLNPDGVTQRWLGPDEVIAFAKERGLDVVPEVYRGPFNMALAKQLTIGDSILAPSQKVREGIVIKAVEGYSDERNSNKALKVISEAYLDGDNTDFH